MEGTILSYKPRVFVDTSNLTEEEWLEYRRHGIGGSDAAAVFGVSPFATARDLYYDKLKIATHEDPEDNWVQKRIAQMLKHFDDLLHMISLFYIENYIHQVLKNKSYHIN